MTMEQNKFGENVASVSGRVDKISTLVEALGRAKSALSETSKQHDLLCDGTVDSIAVRINLINPKPNKYNEPVEVTLTQRGNTASVEVVTGIIAQILCDRMRILFDDVEKIAKRIAELP